MFQPTHELKVGWPKSTAFFARSATGINRTMATVTQVRLGTRGAPATSTRNATNAMTATGWKIGRRSAAAARNAVHAMSDVDDLPFRIKAAATTEPTRHSS